MKNIFFNPIQIKALLKKDLLVRWRQPWMPLMQIVWPCLTFLLLFLIRAKFGPENYEDCQFPTRMLPTKHNVLPGFFSYICSIENKCLNTKEYDELSSYENAPMKPIVDIVQMIINDDNLYDVVNDLPKTGNFLSTVLALVSGGHLDFIRSNVEKVIKLVPQVEKWLNGSFDIKKLFSERRTFVKGGYLLCGHPFPNTESIPLVNDILYSEDFSEANKDELNAMPTPYCKQLYRDVTSSNHGKLTWDTIKPIIHGKILYGPDNDDTRSIMKFTNVTFEELGRLKQLSITANDILTKLRDNEEFQKKLDELIALAKQPFVQSLIGDSFDFDQVESVIERIRTDPIIYDVITTIRNILECFSVERFVTANTEFDLQKQAYELNKERLFYAAVYFNDTKDKEISYKFHMDTDNTQPTFENKNRFWFPGPAASMLRDLKYHRGYIQIKQVIDLAIIKYQKNVLFNTGMLNTYTKESTTKKPGPSIEISTDDDNDDNNNDDDDDDNDDLNFNDDVIERNSEKHNSTQTTNADDDVDDMFNLKLNDEDAIDEFNIDNETSTTTTTITTTPITLTSTLKIDEQNLTEITEFLNRSMSENDDDADDDDENLELIILQRRKRQSGILSSLFDVFTDIASTPKVLSYKIDDMKFYTKQFPYPAYIHDDFKTGLYLAQAIQVAFYLGLIVQIASCVRQRIWMRESRNLMIMRSMGLESSSELLSWICSTFIELLAIFIAVTAILYIGGILQYTNFSFVLIFLIIFGTCLISFCYMCSTFFTSATIGAVSTALLFFISYTPYIIVLLFDAKLNYIENFLINLSFTTAFSHAWSHIMRMELQQTGLTFLDVLSKNVDGEFGFAISMIFFDTLLYIIIAILNLRYKKDDEYCFINVQREQLDSNIGATMKNVSKIYKDNNVALSCVSLTFPRNQIKCLLGRNGAGKSTIIKLLTGQIVQTIGTIKLAQTHQMNDDFDKIGVCSQDNILIPTLTAREHLVLYAKIKQKHGHLDEVNRVLAKLNFGKHESYQACQLSGGYQRRLCVAIAFVGSPNVVILDEPCNGIDAKARKDIWKTIDSLRIGRAVIFTTHFLDEAEFSSDSVVLLKNGKVVAEHNSKTLKDFATTNTTISLRCDNENTVKLILDTIKSLITNFTLQEPQTEDFPSLQIKIKNDHLITTTEFIEFLENLQQKQQIIELSIYNDSLEQMFRNMDNNKTNGSSSINGGGGGGVVATTEVKNDTSTDVTNEYKSFVMRPYGIRTEKLRMSEAVRLLFTKRLKHFIRNYRMLLCVLVLPAIFALLAMWLVSYRLEDDFDKTLKLSRNLYPDSSQIMSIENSIEFTQNLYDNLKADCSKRGAVCRNFANSKDTFYWLLQSLNEYRNKLYGGYSLNGTNALVWYNNKGYHAMMSWLNDLNTHLMQTELNDTDYTIASYNEPWKLGFTELSTTSLLRQVGDSCVAFVLLIAFSLVVAVASVYLVNERINGEKLQQKLCGVHTTTYWLVAFIWDFLIFLTSLAVCIIILLIFKMPVFVGREQLCGIIVLALFFGFACIPAVHVFEKCFNDSSIAIVTVFCMNIIIPLFTVGIIVLLGVIGDSAEWDSLRYFLNRLFLIFPQHALADGLLEICKNFMVALVFRRYDIDSYKNPIHSDLLLPHFISLLFYGLFFTIFNLLLENGWLYQLKEIIYDHLNCFDGHMKRKRAKDDLKIISIQNSLRPDKLKSQDALIVDNISKSYRRDLYAVKNITFTVKGGECVGLLGKNGAGKSTVFKILSGQIRSTDGFIDYFDHEVSYCPQTNTLDALLTVKECMEFYGRLRRVNNIPKLVQFLLSTYQLDNYRDVLVKNLSGGNRRKLTVATTCCSLTPIMLLDEPTSDMDPVTRTIVYRNIDEFIKANCAIVLTSHSIAEIDKICDNIIVLKDGQMLADGTPTKLKEKYGGYYNVVLFRFNDNKLENDKLNQDVREMFDKIADIQYYPHTIKITIQIQSQILKADNVREKNDDEKKMEETKRINTLVELYQQLNSLSKRHNDGEYQLRFVVSTCYLDAVLDRILDPDDLTTAFSHNMNDQNNINVNVNGNGNGNAYLSLDRFTDSPALSGSLSTGYAHKGYVETETTTT